MASAMNASSPSNCMHSIIQDSHFSDEPNKIILIDAHVVITGSFNFTKAAEENNAENLLIIDDAELAKKYTENWNLHLKHSEVYQGRGN